MRADVTSREAESIEVNILKLVSVKIFIDGHSCPHIPRQRPAEPPRRQWTKVVLMSKYHVPTYRNFSSPHADPRCSACCHASVDRERQAEARSALCCEAFVIIKHRRSDARRSYQYAKTTGRVLQVAVAVAGEHARTLQLRSVLPRPYQSAEETALVVRFDGCSWHPSATGAR